MNDTEFWQYLVVNMPNFLGLLLLAWVLVRQDRSHERRIDRLLDWCLNKRCDDDDNERSYGQDATD